MIAIEKAISIAVEAHRGQVDKAEKPYILHPLRLMLKMTNEKEMVVAVLHDVVEDTGWTIEKLAEEGFNSEIIEAIKLLTHNKNESYEKYIEKIKSNELATRVKIADLEDNMDLKRIAKPKLNDYARISQYHRFYFELKETTKFSK